MRNVWLASAAVLLFSGLSLAQGPGRVIGGSYYPGVFVGPFIPLVSTPSASWNNFVPQAGATNATEGNFAGASAAGVQSGHFGLPWHAMHHEGMMAEEHHGPSRAGSADWGMAASEFSESVIVAMGQPHAVAPAGTPRTITNQDVEQVNQKNGYVKYGDHVEHWNQPVTP